MPLREGITFPIRQTHLAIDLGQGQANPDFKASDLIGFAPPLRAPTEHRSCVGVVGCTPGGFLALAKLPSPTGRTSAEGQWSGHFPRVFNEKMISFLVAQGQASRQRVSTWREPSRDVLPGAASRFRRGALVRSGDRFGLR